MNAWGPEGGDEPAGPPWWAAIGGGAVFAAAVLALLWAFAIIEWLLEPIA